MAQLLLRGVALGEVKGVLFDKDGTLSISEPQLITLAETRVFLCLQRVEEGQRAELRDLLGRAYGLRPAAGRPGSGICPAGITAVANRDHNLIATATALVQVGMGWPEALSLSEQVFDAADRLDARRAVADGGPGPQDQAGVATARRQAIDPELRLHLDSAGHAVGGTSRTTEGLREWLQQLRSAAIPCAVISNDDVAGIEHFLASHGLEPYFAAIWSAEHHPRKPDPAAVHGLCAVLGLQAADCALIGDANSDLRMAVAAGIPQQLTLGYTAAWTTPPPLAEPHPLVHHWRELNLA